MTSSQRSPGQSQAGAAPGSGPGSGAGYGNNAEEDMAAGDGAADDTATGGLEEEGSDEQAVLGGNSLPEGGERKATGGETDLADSEAGPGSTIPGAEVTGKTA